MSQSSKDWRCLSAKAWHSSPSFPIPTSNQTDACGLARLDDEWRETFSTSELQTASDTQQLALWVGGGEICAFPQLTQVPGPKMTVMTLQLLTKTPGAIRNWVDGEGRRGGVSPTSLDLSANCGDGVLKWLTLEHLTFCPQSCQYLAFLLLCPILGEPA